MKNGSSPVVLSVHRNTVEKRRVRTTAREMQVHVGRLIKTADIRAYAIVGIDANGDSFAQWDTGGSMPLVAFPDVVRTILSASVGESGVKDDWRPNLNPKRADD